MFSSLSLSVKPYFLLEPEDVTAQSGDNVHLSCEVGGDPDPVLVWHREDGRMPKGRTQVVKGILSIESVNPQDEGIYICEAENEAGIVRVGASIAVHGKILERVFIV
jgi:hypothetical protein